MTRICYFVRDNRPATLRISKLGCAVRYPKEAIPTVGFTVPSYSECLSRARRFLSGVTANYCQNCGAGLGEVDEFCAECGTKVGVSGSSSDVADEGSEAAEQRVDDSSDTMFKATAGLVAGYFLFAILGIGISSNGLVGLAALCLIVSLVTMYVDMRDLKTRLWGTRPILWVIGAALLYIVVAPLYLYKRSQLD